MSDGLNVPASAPPPIPAPSAPPTSAEAARDAVVKYFTLLSVGQFGLAWQYWSDGGRASGMSPDEFARSFQRFAYYRADVGAPGRIEGAAGSLYITVPVRTYGTLASGERFEQTVAVTLRRSNDVPGSTPAQRLWHIASIGPPNATTASS